jgi:hypothetical protein
VVLIGCVRADLGVIGSGGRHTLLIARKRWASTRRVEDVAAYLRPRHVQPSLTIAPRRFLQLDGGAKGGYCLGRTDFIAGLPARKSSENLLPTFLFPGCQGNRVRKSV